MLKLYEVKFTLPEVLTALVRVRVQCQYISDAPKLAVTLFKEQLDYASSVTEASVISVELVEP